ncbi:hypothetical protein [Pontivivens ytuae]|uniref:Uncharacterized protein n=1 Tax=Pontivivens ytuae TaxID=2789856 RepID=A0A7S9QCX7_9RHOB|nr:hypothetical protein [Pontivivens ytuae]QPH53812.1 hypothetical protein I0K15_18865 [Pontivivens ytuae]
MGTLDKLRPVVDDTISASARARFRTDPIGGERYSRQTSIISSAYKRHGQILERALRERLSESEYFTVWHEPEFRVSDIADRAINGRNSDIPDGGLIELPYGDPARTIQVDSFVYDSRIKSLRAYEIKRGNGHFDAGKKRSILRDVLCTQSLLRSYGSATGLDISIAEARVICYFGVRALPPPLSLVAEDLDDHFVFSVKSHVERVNQYFQEQLYMLLEGINSQTQLDFDGLCATCPIKGRPQSVH